MSRRTQKNVGVIGLGIIGQRVAASLRRRGFSVFVWNRTPRPFPNFVGSPAEIAQLCDYIQIFVSDDEALLEMVQNLKQSLKAHHIVMAHSTVAPHTMRAAAEIVHRRGAQFLDAPFTGSKMPAEKGELVYYIGGDDAEFKRARPVLEASSKEIIEIGEIGQATLVKIATNMVTAATVQAAAEALALVHNAGLAPAKLVAAMKGNASNSATLSAKLPKMMEGDFEPHFSVKHMLKDVQIASRLAQSYGLALGATEAARDSLLEEARQDRGDDDFSSLIRIFFPDGPAMKQAPEAEPEQEPTLPLEERAAASDENRPAPDPVAEVSEITPVPSAPDEPVSHSETNGIESEGLEESETPGDGGRRPPLQEGPEGLEAVEAEAQPAQETAHSEELTMAPTSAPSGDAADEEDERRGFFSRMFRKGSDY